MSNASTKNFWIVDLDKYELVLLASDGNTVLESGFNLAEENTDSGERLRRLVDFIRRAKRRVQDFSLELTSLLPFGVSRKVAEQIVCLAYWKNYRLEFRIDKAKGNVVIWVRFPNNPELNCVLDHFADGFDAGDELQGWLDCLCSIISDHTEIWQIHLVVNESVYENLVVPAMPANSLKSRAEKSHSWINGSPRFPDLSSEKGISQWNKQQITTR